MGNRIKIFLALILSALILLGCEQTCYQHHNYATLSDYSTKNKSAEYTESGVKVYLNDNYTSLTEVDKKTIELEQCLGISIPRECFAVYVPSDWYISACSGQELLPVPAPLEQCRVKGLEIADECEGLEKPTPECPCVCNYRVSLQDNYLIVVTPNLLLYKAELARLVTGINNVWADDEIRECIK